MSPARQPAKSTSPKIALGRKGEDLAAQHLESLSYTILERNWRTKGIRQEIDIIAQDGDTIVFVEVKTARTKNFGDPLSWITPRKCAAIVTAAQAFLAGWHQSNCDYRFDAVTVGPPDASGKLPVKHIRAAFMISDG